VSTALELGPLPGSGDGSGDRQGSRIRYAPRFDLPHGAFGRWYYPKLFGPRTTDASFAVFDRGKPVVTLECDVTDEILGRFTQPVHLGRAAEADRDLVRRAIRLCFSNIDEVSRSLGARTVLVADMPSAGVLTEIGKECLSRKGVPRLAFRGVADLDAEPAQLWRDLRKSYRSLINWGRNNLSMRFVNAENPDISVMKSFQEFHLRTAGRATRPQETWDAMFEWIVSGKGEAILGYLGDGSLVAATMVLDTEDAAVYTSGVYDRDRFDSPIAHWPLYLSMERAAARGNRLYDIGEIPVFGEASQKEYSIGYFKRGFTSRIISETVWTIECNVAASSVK
jgi:hypothetical protein